MRLLARATAAISLSVITLIAIACSSSSEPTTPTATPAYPTGDITVFAASSLTLALEEIGDAFETKYPETDVTFNFAGTPTLRTQLEQGARADVFASANAAQMQLAIGADVIDGTPSTFATNRLVVITPAGGSVQSLADLTADGTLIVLALPDVPVGAYARQALDRLSGANGLPADFAEQVLDNVVSEETNVRQVIAKVALGEADAGIVYTSDVTSEVRDNMESIEIPADANVIATYPVARVEDASNPSAGSAFIDFLLSDEGQSILAAYGFGPAS